MRRQGFTLVELLVSTALIVLIMAVISQAFVEGLDSFRHLKAIGDLQERLRTASSLLRTDLAAPHFEKPRRLSDLGTGKPRPSEGFFRIQAAAATGENSDGDGIPSSRANHLLHFTIQTTGRLRDDWLISTLPLTLTGQPLTTLTEDQYAPDDFESRPPYTQNPPNLPLLLSQSAEVVWWLQPQVDTLGQQMTAGTTPLYTLRRSQRLLVPNNGSLNDNTNTVNRVNSTVIPFSQFSEVSAKIDGAGPYIRFNNLVETTNPQNRALQTGANPTPSATNDDLVMADVVSFEVKVLGSGNSATFQNLTTPYPGTYDTGDPAVTPDTLLQIRAIQITLRVFDYKTEQTRQVTITQDM